MNWLKGDEKLKLQLKWAHDLKELYKGIHAAGRDSNLENHANALKGTVRIVWNIKIKPFVDKVDRYLGE